MQFVFEPMNEDGSGDIVVTAENVAEMIELERWHFERPEDIHTPEGAIAYAARLSIGRCEYRKHSKKRPHYACSATLDVDYSAPYYVWLNRVTGYVGRGILPDVDLTPLYVDQWKATRLVTDIRLEHGHIIGRGYMSSEPWNGMSAEDYAEKSFYRYLAEEFGEQEVIREFIENGNGTLRRNPDYGRKRAAVYPCRYTLSNQWLKETLFNWWIETFANEQQKKVVRKDIATNATITRGGKATATPCGASEYTGGFRLNWEAPVVKYAEFQAMNDNNG